MKSHAGPAGEIFGESATALALPGRTPESYTQAVDVRLEVESAVEYVMNQGVSRH